MDVNLESTKLRLIQLIMSINDNITLVELEKKASEITEKSELIHPDIDLAVKPILSNISLEEIDKKQNYQRVSYKEFRVDADKLNLKEPIGELLNILTK